MIKAVKSAISFVHKEDKSELTTPVPFSREWMGFCNQRRRLTDDDSLRIGYRIWRLFE